MTCHAREPRILATCELLFVVIPSFVVLSLWAPMVLILSLNAVERWFTGKRATGDERLGLYCLTWWGAIWGLSVLGWSLWTRIGERQHRPGFVFRLWVAGGVIAGVAASVAFFYWSWRRGMAQRIVPYEVITWCGLVLGIQQLPYVVRRLRRPSARSGSGVAPTASDPALRTPS